VIQSFKDAGTERLWNREYVKKFDAIARPALRKLGALNAAISPQVLAVIPGNNLEKLEGDRKGQWSIRINDQWRICFRWRDNDAYDVEIADYH